MSTEKLIHDGGAKSRKLWFCAGAIVAGILCALRFEHETLRLVLDFIVWVTAIFAGGNVGVKVAAAVAARKRKGKLKPSEKQEGA